MAESRENHVYLNGEYLPHSQAMVSVDDRGFLFGDGVYEVARYVQGKPRALDRHQNRLVSGLDQIRITPPGEVVSMRTICDHLMEINGLSDAILYWQITRGAAPRTHAFPQPPVRPTVYVAAREMAPLQKQNPLKTVSAITLPDDRWMHCAIKSVNLLPNVLASQLAAEQGAYDALLYRDDQLMEASARSVMIIKDGIVMAPPLRREILPSVTRSILKDVMVEEGIAFEERAVSMKTVHEADEILLAGTGTAVVSVIYLDGKPVGDGAAGNFTRRLHDAYIDWVLRSMA